MLFSRFFPPIMKKKYTEFLYNFRNLCEEFDNNWVKKSIFQVLSVASPQKVTFPCFRPKRVASPVLQVYDKPEPNIKRPKSNVQKALTLIYSGFSTT